MVKLLEYQGKLALRDAGLQIPDGRLVGSPEEVREVVEKLNKPVAIKAQILATGRFKAGGIKFATTAEEAEKAAKQLLGSSIKGYVVDKVLVEEKMNVKKEYYVGVIVDDSYKIKSPVIMLSTEGGVDIEEVAKRSPEKVASTAINILKGFGDEEAKLLTSKLQIEKVIEDGIASAMKALYSVFRKYDARIAEINPLVQLNDNRIVAADCRLTVDDSSLSRHPELGIKVSLEVNRPLTALEKAGLKTEEGDYRGISYFLQMTPEIKETGYVGFHGIGGGGAMVGADALARHGIKIANYADTSGNPTASKVYRTATLILSQPGIEGYFLSGSVIASQEQWHHANGIVKAFKEMLKDKVGFPVIILIAGNKEKEAIEILKEGLKELPIRLEIYGREYVYKVDYLAERMKQLMEEYRKTKEVT